MKTVSIIAYIAGTLLLMTTCFLTNVALLWWISAIAALLLVVGCVLQFNYRRVPAHSYVRRR